MAHQSHRVPANIQDVQYQNLNGRVRRVDEHGTYAKHSGGLSDIFVGLYTNKSGHSVKVAIKVLRIVGDQVELAKKVTTRLIRETTVWSGLRHPNILEFYGLAMDHGRSGCPALISPYCDNGTIMNFLGENATPAIRLGMISGVVNALYYLHSKDVIHGDLKPSNILISNDGQPLLGDFGTSRIITHQGFTTNTAGTVRYQAPELLEDNAKCTKASDVYALGMTCSEIWTGRRPHSDLHTDPPIVTRVLVHQGRPPCPSSASQETRSLWNLFEHCWRTDPQKRLQTKDVMKSLNTSSTIFSLQNRP